MISIVENVNSSRIDDLIPVVISKTNGLLEMITCLIVECTSSIVYILLLYKLGEFYLCSFA